MSATAEPVAAAEAPEVDNTYPPGIPFIVGNEGAERFSYYGMRAILSFYLAQLFLGFLLDAPAEAVTEAEAHASEVFHVFAAGVYLFPLIGAILADRLLGKYRVIFWVSMIYCAGHAVLAVAGRLAEVGDLGPAEYGMYIGLGLIAVGSGGIKPCVSANVGDQFTKKNGHLVSRIFQIFYWIINFGSFFATLLIPTLYKEFGAEVAFGVPGILMAIATFVFWLGRKRFVHVPPNPGGKLGALDTLSTICLLSPIFALILGYFGFGTVTATIILVIVAVALVALGLWLWSVRQKMQPDNGFLTVLLWSFRNRSKRQPGQGFFDPARQEFGEETGDGPPAVLKIMVVFSMLVFFWALFDQHGSTWVFQAKRMDLVLVLPEAMWIAIFISVLTLAVFGGTWLFLHLSNKHVSKNLVKVVLGIVVVALATAGVFDAINGGVTQLDLEPTQIQALNPLMVMILIPFLGYFVFRPRERRGKAVKPLMKMTIGMFLAAGAFVIAAVLQEAVEGAGESKIHVMWQIPQYLIMTTSEVLVSITALEFAYTQAPRSMKSTIMGFFLLTVTFGNLIVAFLSPLQKTLALSEFFFVFAGLMGAAALIFMILARSYRGKTYLQE